MMRWVSIVLVALFGLFIFYVSQPAFIKKVSDFTTVDWVAILFVPTAVVVAHFANRFSKAGRLTSRDLLWLAVALVSILVISIIMFHVHSETGVAIIVGAYLASLGWIYTNYVNGHMQRKAHTMNALISLRNSTEFNKHRSLLLARFPFGHPVTANDLGPLKVERANGASYASDKVPVLDSAYYILNYFEFLSVGVLNQDLDDTMIEKSYRTIFMNWFRHLEPLIHDAQIETSGERNTSIYINYMTLVRKYQGKAGKA